MSYRDIVLSDEEQVELSQRLNSATISPREGRRAQVILLAAQGCSRTEIARLTGLSVVSVTRWCKRFRELRLSGLVDLPGRGRKAYLPAEALKQTLDQVTQPRIGHARWSCRSMAKLVGISPASVQRIWAANDMKPHLTHTPKLSSDSGIEEESGEVGVGISGTPE
ncbi:IS630 family transposase [Pseudomonas syringae]|nr:Winged helix-turn helix [Pseudomonas syringae pv. syringae B301D]PPS38126.1 IS630 family transposase [Pseudomonas syringae]